MKKKTLIIVASLIYTFILFGILLYRLYLINTDTSGLFELKDNDFIFFLLTFLPEISILFAMLAANLRKSIGLIFTALAGIITVLSFVVELFIKIVKSVEVMNKVSTPPPVVPWLNIPVLIIIIILFVVKMHIFNLPNEVSFKSKKRR